VDFYTKLNANERLAAIGAAVLVIAWLVGVVVGYGVGVSTVGLIGAIIVLAIYFLKYSPTQTVTWPAPIPTIVLVVAAISALLTLLDVVQLLRFLDGIDWLVAIASVAGAALMVWGAWQEYQAMPKATPPTSGGPRV
jgi:multisubunit Na+/H+ antiporter MnhG subunit